MYLVWQRRDFCWWLDSWYRSRAAAERRRAELGDAKITVAARMQRAA